MEVKKMDLAIRITKKGLSVWGIPRDAAIRRAEYVAENPFPPKDPGRKVIALAQYALRLDQLAVGAIN